MSTETERRLKLSAPQQDLLDGLRRGAICHYMPYAGRFNPTPYYFRSDTMAHCTKQVEALIKRGLAERFDVKQYGDHKIRAAAAIGESHDH